MSVPDLECLRALVRRSGHAVGLLALSTRTFLGLSPTAISLSELRTTDEPLVDLATLTAEPASVRQTLDLLAEGVLDACRLCTTIATAGDERGLLVSLRGIARDANQAYAIALFSVPALDASARGFGHNGDRHAPTVEALLGPLRTLGDPARRTEERQLRREPRVFAGLEDLTDRQQEILTRLLDGDRVTTISRGMHLSASTVRNHLSTLYRKVGVHSQAELIERLHASTGN